MFIFRQDHVRNASITCDQFAHMLEVYVIRINQLATLNLHSESKLDFLGLPTVLSAYAATCFHVSCMRTSNHWGFRCSGA
jgi:phosphoribosylpyrophosphate synthetase